jgi:hypothetical protein
LADGLDKTLDEVTRRFWQSSPRTRLIEIAGIRMRLRETRQRADTHTGVRLGLLRYDHGNNHIWLKLQIVLMLPLRPTSMVSCDRRSPVQKVSLIHLADYVLALSTAPLPQRFENRSSQWVLEPVKALRT